MLSWLAVTAVLLVILLTNQVARVLARAAENLYPRGVVMELIGLSTLQNIGVLMPIGLLLGVVLAFGRLYHESEMAAAHACGIGPARIYGPIVIFAAFITGAIAWVTLSLAPDAASKTYSLRNEALRAGQFSAVEPGRFRTFGGGSAVIYAQSTGADGELERVFVKRTREDNLVEVALAERARHEVSSDGMTHTITLFDGARYEGVPGSPRFRIVRFAEQVVPIRLPELLNPPRRVEAAPTSELLASSDLKDRAELHWRIALPIMAITLTILAVPLSQLRPRQGRYARVWIAILIYFVYSNLASAGRVWIERGVVPEALGLWWVHIALIAIAGMVIYWPRALARLKYRAVPA